MPTELSKVIVPKFPLRMMPSVRETARRFSKQEGVSLNQFINVAVAERVARLEHEEWAGKRRKPTKERLERALSLLEKAGSEAPQPGDELPEGYVSLR